MFYDITDEYCIYLDFRFNILHVLKLSLDQQIELQITCKYEEVLSTFFNYKLNLQ